MKSVTAVLALACAAVLGAPASAQDLQGVVSHEQGSLASQSRTLHANADVINKDEEYCGEGGEPPCPGIGCADGFQLSDEGDECLFVGGRALLQNRVKVSARNTVAVGGRKGKGGKKPRGKKPRGKKPRSKKPRSGKKHRRNGNRRNKNRNGKKGKRGNNKRRGTTASAGFDVDAQGSGPVVVDGTSTVAIADSGATVFSSTSVSGFAGSSSGGGSPKPPAPPPPGPTPPTPPAPTPPTPTPPPPPGTYGGPSPPGTYGIPSVKPTPPPSVKPTPPPAAPTPPPATPKCSGDCAPKFGRCSDKAGTYVKACCEADTECVMLSSVPRCMPTFGRSFFTRMGKLQCHN